MLYTRRRSKQVPSYLKKIASNFKKKFDKIKKKGKSKVAKGFFGLTFDGVRDNKDGTKKKTLSLRKKKKAITIH